MPLQNIGIPGIILILIFVLFIFGPSRLPEIGRAIGSTLKEFKIATKELVSSDEKNGKKVKNTTHQFEDGE